LGWGLVVVGIAACSTVDRGERPGRVGRATSALTASLEAEITDVAGLTTDGYGTSLAVSPADDDLVTGAPDEAGAGARQGAAYTYYQIYGARSWGFRQRLVAPDGGAGDAFGAGVAIDATTALVGAPGDDDGAADAGAVYVFTRSG